MLDPDCWYAACPLCQTAGTCTTQDGESFTCPGCNGEGLDPSPHACTAEADVTLRA